MKRAGHENVALLDEDRPPIAARKTDGSVDQRLQDRIEVEHRAADDLEDVGGRRLLRKRLFEVTRLGADFLEEPRVLDRDHCLIGEGLELRDLGFGEWRDFGAPEHDRPKSLATRASEAPREWSSMLCRAGRFATWPRPAPA